MACTTLNQGLDRLMHDLLAKVKKGKKEEKENGATQ